MLTIFRGPYNTILNSGLLEVLARLHDVLQDPYGYPNIALT